MLGFSAPREGATLTLFMQGRDRAVLCGANDLRGSGAIYWVSRSSKLLADPLC
jgi:hypothetical protein